MNEDAVYFAFTVCLFILIILCVGDPDIIDAIVHCLMK